MNVLYVSYNGLTEPLGRRQVLPYIVGLAARGWRFHVLSFEKPETADATALATVAREAVQAGLDWKPLRYHRRPQGVAKVYDIVSGFLTGLLRQREIGLIHARSTVAAAVAAPLAALLRVPWIFDVRGLVAEEYADAGHWRRTGRLFRLTEAAERKLLQAADGLVFLTDRIKTALQDRRAFRTEVPVTVIPCCADLGVFRPDPEARARVRAELGLGDGPVLVYAGSLGSWYRFREMAAFFAEARRQIAKLRFLVLTPQVQLARDVARELDLEREVIIRTLRPEEVPRYLAAADAGICFLADVPSKNASSPTKYGEYLGCGLPVITNVWTGDAACLSQEPSWILIDSFESKEYERAATRLKTLLDSGPRGQEAARALARREFSLETAIARYDALYHTLTGAGV